MKQSLILFLGFSIILLAPGINSVSQTYKFRNFGIEDELCHPFVYSVNQDVNGYIWACTGDGLCRYDGSGFYGDFAADSLPTELVRKSFRDSRGNLWFGHNDGSITFYNGLNFRVIDLDESINSSIYDIAEDPEGRIVFATQNQGLIIVEDDFNIIYIREAFARRRISSIAFTSTGQLLVGSFDGLHMFSYDFTGDTVSYLEKVPGIPYTQVTDIVYNSDAGLYLIGTGGEGLLGVRFAGESAASAVVSRIDIEDRLQSTHIISIFRDSKDYIWLSTKSEGLYKISLNIMDLSITELVQFNQENGLGTEYTMETFEDVEGNIWIGTFGDGLAALFDEAFTFYEYNDLGGNTIYSVLADSNGYWMGGEGQMVRVNRGVTTTTQVYNSSNGLPNDRITALYQDEDGTLWIGTGQSGVYRWRGGMAGSYFTSGNTLERTINAIDGSGNVLWVATSNGVVSLNTETGAIEHFGIGINIPHNKINDIFVDSKNVVWIATPRSNGLYSVNSDKRYTFSERVVDFVSITEDDHGSLWAASSNDGVYHFLSDTLKQFSTPEGLKNSACYSILNDKKGHIWVGHYLGMSRIEVDRDMVVTYGTETGIIGDVQPNASSVTTDGIAIFGTSEGLVQYDTDKDRKNLTAPITSISSVLISDTEYDFSKPIVLPYGIYKLRIDFIGLNFFAPEKVTYQYILDGYDEWSEPSPIPYVQYSRIEDGNYTFRLRACNSEGVCTEEPVEFSLRVKLPVWKTWWFISLSVFILIAAVFVIIKYRERKAKQFQELLQRKLDERTREVVMQKEEIEIKNKDITDSINYAQRIQASILPPISRLHDTFGGSFVFYQPRDIVSGDFYWYDMVGPDKFVIVCADSTGHGVPGAFMSMIGTTLLKDITVRQEVDSPASLLSTLDQEIMSALNQNIEAEQSHDGMDIIVSEIDLKTQKLRISSAMRPMIIYKGGEQIYVRGSRSSVGGQYEKEKKVFDIYEYQMEKGDKVYMFSDGYPDQFGGPLGKKFKMVRLKNMLRDIHDKTMEEQYNYIKNNFEIWKEDVEQVDDVLFMGIEI
jgi:ligand-binding sensor domain-containing protein/serine phosphatase RsbU (regulator of sigma subunit)